MMFSKTKFYSLFIGLFLVLASLLGTHSPHMPGYVYKVFQIPEVISTNVFLLYSVIMFFTFSWGAINLTKRKSLYLWHGALIFAYFLFMLWALASASEQVRYILLFLSVSLTPLTLVVFMNEANSREIARYISTIFFVFLIISALYSILNYTTHSRISGIHNNPNLMGMWIVSFLAVFLSFDNYYKRYTIAFGIAISTILVMMTGSRLALGILLILLIPHILKVRNISVVAIACLTVLAIMATASNFGDIEGNTRGLNFTNSVYDSGRISYWVTAIECIRSQPLVGHGMNGAQECVDAGNVHNAYLRVAVMLGLPLSVLFFLSFFVFIAMVFFSSLKAPIRYYFLGLPVAFFAEDYVTSFGSPFFPFFLFVLALAIQPYYKTGK